MIFCVPFRVIKLIIQQKKAKIHNFFLNLQSEETKDIERKQKKTRVLTLFFKKIIKKC